MNRTCIAATLLLLAGCEGTLYVTPAEGGGPPSIPQVLVDGGTADAGPGSDGGGGLQLCTLPPAGECAGNVARWCEGTSTREETCANGCALDTTLNRYACSTGGTEPPVEPPVEPPAETGCESAIEAEERTLTNQARAENGLGALSCDVEMGRAARKHSQDMCDQGYFSHTGLDGRSPFDRMRDEGVSYGTAGENIAQGQTSPAQVHNSWMNSSGHRANILNGAFGRIGVGYVECAGRHYWTQVFAD
ncbi:MAG: CAP domain-containing protein [Sandaracinaceae bacterium]